MSVAEQRVAEFFSRQTAVPDWHDPLIEHQRALVLGVGGIGCTVAKELCRLGLSTIVLVDNGVVSPSNLNRQILFSVADVGRRKVDAALEGLSRHIIRSNVRGLHKDAVLEWSDIVELARQSTVVFNCIDYGEYFDYAVTSLCVSLSLPYVSASSYGHSAVAECYPAVEYPQKGPCWGCNNAPAKTEILERITPDKILNLKSLEFLPKDSYMPSNQDVGSSVFPCTLGATMTTGAWLNSIHGYDLPNWITCDFALFQLFSYPAEPNPNCLICNNAPKYSLSTVDIYFGTETVLLSQVSGETLPVNGDCISNPVTEALLEAAKKKLQPLSELGEEYGRIYIPAIPAAELEFSPSKVSGDVTGLPEQLQIPLVKCSDGEVTAIRSGDRSCILPTTSGCYRLKGCGNYVTLEDGNSRAYQGFPTKKMEGREDGGLEIRGCCFKHTALTEQYMSGLVNEVTTKHGIPVGNRPMAMWRYTLPEEPFPAVSRYCGLFETLGEKRLGSHLIPGLEALLPVLYPSISLDQVMALFPAERLAEDKDTGSLTVRPTWQACCTGSNKSAPINMCLTPLPERNKAVFDYDGIPLRLVGPYCQATCYLKQCLPLNQEDTISCGSLMAILYWQLGWEMGVVKSALETNDINWGYFLDHNPFEPHCNSHPNNFIVLTPDHKNFLAPVDFDLSFQRVGFFSPYNMSHDQQLFDSWMASEHTELERALSGETANTGLTMIKSMVGSSQVYQALSWAFRDTMLCGYRTAYSGCGQGLANPHPLPGNLKQAADFLIRTALIKTHSSSA